MELLSADGVPFHKSCFKCSHCKSTLQLSNYSSMEGVLYCKPHFEQLFKETGSFNKNFQSRMYTSCFFFTFSLLPFDQTLTCGLTLISIFKLSFVFKAAKPLSDKLTPELTRTPSRLAGMFSGTQDKCATCSKTVYPIEKVKLDDTTFTL
ncbi:unnamed protein product [Thlaspi arvense]|uniref:LIM zinc-binding domain-containing protein n=1 Tax=Thlaspi arvense TaxID=13288 RepID=A0AAU9S716_THLAR|nr:unnamed protein product [Thlaspi arvense]